MIEGWVPKRIRIVQSVWYLVMTEKVKAIRGGYHRILISKAFQPRLLHSDREKLNSLHVSDSISEFEICWAWRYSNGSHPFNSFYSTTCLSTVSLSPYHNSLTPCMESKSFELSVVQKCLHHHTWSMVLQVCHRKLVKCLVELLCRSTNRFGQRYGKWWNLEPMVTNIRRYLDTCWVMEEKSCKIQDKDIKRVFARALGSTCSRAKKVLGWVTHSQCRHKQGKKVCDHLYKSQKKAKHSKTNHHLTKIYPPLTLDQDPINWF